MEDIKKRRGFHKPLCLELVTIIILIILLMGNLNIIFIIILTTFYIFARYTIIKTLPECFYYLKYRGLKIEKTYITSVKILKEEEKIIFTIYSYLPATKIFDIKNSFENFLMITILSIEPDKHNKRKFKIIAQKGNKQNNLVSILSGYGYLTRIKSEAETEFYKKIGIEINNASIRDITKLKDDISFRLKKRITIELYNGLFIFKIHKPSKKKYDFNKAINDLSNHDLSNYKLPCLLGIDQESGEYVIADLLKTLDVFINGIKGSGKSCIFNGMIQSILLWNQNIQITLVDFKYVEFIQYRDLNNITFIHKMDDFKVFIEKLLIEMHKRYKLFKTHKNITEYNNNNNSQLPFLIICIDELSFISSQKDKDIIWQDLITIIQMGRAAGIIILSATQCPDHTQIDTTFRRQIDTKIIGRLRQQSDAKICGIETKEDITSFDVGEFFVDATGIGKIKIKSLFLEGLTKGLTYGLTPKIQGPNLTKNQTISGFEEMQTCQLDKKNEKGLTENLDFLKLCRIYFQEFKNGELVPSFQEAKKRFPEITDKKYKTIKQKLCQEGIIYKSTPTSTKYKIKKNNW